MLTILYGVWLFPRVARLVARRYLQRLVVALRDRHMPATEDEVASVLAHCLMSPTGRHLMAGLATAGTESGNASYTPEAIAVLKAFVVAKQTTGDGIELDAATLRWLEPPKFSWARFRERWAGSRR